MPNVKGMKYQLKDRELKHISDFQKHLQTLKEIPLGKQIERYLSKVAYTTPYTRPTLLKFANTRFNRGVLNEAEIREWHEFYFKPKEGFRTGLNEGGRYKNYFISDGRIYKKAPTNQ